jgi:hypothetical protein
VNKAESGSRCDLWPVPSPQPGLLQFDGDRNLSVNRYEDALAAKHESWFYRVVVPATVPTKFYWLLKP